MRVFDRLLVAADAPAVRGLCESIGAPVVMTDPGLPSGTDRVWEVARQREFREFPVIVNVQGDEPLVEESHLEAAVRLVRERGWGVGTCAAPLRTAAAREDPSVVKVARAAGGRALYFSRSPIPGTRDRAPEAEELARPPFLRHLGVYAYGRDALARWVGLEPSPLERLERLEQLRALEDGISIGVAVVERAGPGVDTPGDVLQVEGILSGTSRGRSP